MSEEVKTTPAQSSDEAAKSSQAVQEAQKTQKTETVSSSDASKSEGSTPLTEKKSDDKEGQSAKKDIPQTYDLKLPEGSLLDPKRVEALTAFAKERGLSNEEAQGLLEREHSAVQSFQDGQLKLVEEAKAGWLKASSEDKEFGGQAFKENAEVARRAIDAFGSESLKQELERSGLGNHPELIRFAYRIGKAMSDDKIVVPKTEVMGASKKSMEETFYGADTK